MYAHFPFCANRCLYCGCNAIPTSRFEKMDTYLDDLELEHALVTGHLGKGRPVRQMHWGSGTPNLPSETQTERALRLRRDNFTFMASAELSVECDPRVVEPNQLAHDLTLGFSRVSFDVQDLNSEVQQAIGRVQPLALVCDVYHQARRAGFEQINLDLIYGLPHQTMQSVDETLEAVLALDPDRLATFSCAHLPAQRPHQRAIPVDALPNTVERVALCRHIVKRLTGAGYVWIGFDHFARANDPLVIAQREGRLHRNFMGYTPFPARHLLGVGMSSISEVAGTFGQNDAELPSWSASVRTGKLPIVRGHALTEDDRTRGTIIRDLLSNFDAYLPVGRIGPNVLIQTAHALAHRVGHDTADRVLQANTHHTFETLPTEMVDEATANALVRHLVDTYGLPFTRAVMRDAGDRTGEYLLKHQIPWIARVTLPALPSGLALRFLLAAIGRQTWTFAGSAQVDILPGTPSVISLKRCPMCAGIHSREPSCDFYVATFRRLVQALLGPPGFAEEITCEARGDSACSFAIGTRVS